MSPLPPYSVLMCVCGKDSPAPFALALDSMLAQTHPSDDIVLVLDGPIPSELSRVLEERMAREPSIVPVPLQANVGLGAALNEGLKHCRHDLVARMDADDISLPGRCERLAGAFAEKPGLAVVGSPVLEFVGSPDNIVGRHDVPLANDEIYRFAKRRDPFAHPAVMFRKSAILRVGGYASYRKNQDTDLWLRLLATGVECRNLPEPLLLFRFDENTYRKRKSWLNTKNLLSIRHNAWKSGFTTFPEFLSVAVAQLAVFALPVGFTKFLYKTFLRK